MIPATQIPPSSGNGSQSNIQPSSSSLSHPRKSYDEIVIDILEQITTGISKERHLFESSRAIYGLHFDRTIQSIVSVEGIVSGQPHVFEKGVDYALSTLPSPSTTSSSQSLGGGADDARLVSKGTFGQQEGNPMGKEGVKILEWIGTIRPDDGTEFKVSYRYNDASRLTDVNTGSVLRTVVEAIGKELDDLYSRMEKVYKSGFIDTATGEALDLVAAVVGVKRKPPTHAMGYVTFWRTSDPPETQVSGEDILYDGRDSYVLQQPSVKSITAVKGKVSSIPYTFTKDKDYNLDKIRNSVVWLRGTGATPDPNTPFSVDYVIHQRIAIPKGTLVSTFSPSSSPSSNPKLFETAEDSMLTKDEKSGYWESGVLVKALEPGRGGNVPAGAIRLMPTSIVGVEHCLNRASLDGGMGYEDDNSLRSRAKKAMDVTGRATTVSLRTALEGIDGIQSSPIIRENPDNIPGLVKVIVDGGDKKKIEQVIEVTRAAGIRIEFDRPQVVELDFSIVVVVDIAKAKGLLLQRPGEPIAVDGKAVSQGTTGITAAAGQGAESGGGGVVVEDIVRSRIIAKVRDFVSSLRIGDRLVYNQLLSAILGAEATVHDLKELNIDIYKDGVKTLASVTSNINTGEYERLYPRDVQVRIEDLEDMNINDNSAAGGYS